MAHQLETTADGRSSMAFTGDRDLIWHHLGQSITDPSNPQQCLTDAGLDWTVRMDPLFLADGRKVKRFATIRESDNSILGTVGDSYQIRQNADAITILEHAVRDFGVKIDTCGAIYGGSKVWVLAKMDADVTVKAKGGEDKVEGYFLTGWSHDGSSSHYGKLTPTRVVCANTLSAAMLDGSPMTINIPHTLQQDRQLDEAKQLVTRMAAALKETGATFNKLANRKMSKDAIVSFIESVFPNPVPEKDASKQLLAKREQVIELVDSCAGADLAGKTAWGAYNAVTFYVDHVRPTESKTDETTFSAWTAALFGAGDDLKLRALKQARQLVAA